MLNNLVSDVKELCEQASEVKEIDGKHFSVNRYFKIDTKDRAETLPFSDLSSTSRSSKTSLKNTTYRFMLLSTTITKFVLLQVLTAIGKESVPIL